jgi:hypothetical protein
MRVVPRIISAVLPVLALAVACSSENQVSWDLMPAGMVVTVTSVDGEALPTVAEPLSVPAAGAANGIEVEVDVRALSGAGDVETLNSDMWVRLSVRPGKLTILSADRFVGSDLFLPSGQTSNVKVKIWDLFGPTRIWVEDVGFEPRTQVNKKSACDDGIDNDQDGLIDDPADIGCLSPMDDSEEPGTDAAGVSPVIWFMTPTLAELQGYAGDSPYVSESVPVETGSLVVTRVTTDGMYVTDEADLSGRGYNHLFVYTFNSPTTVPVCNSDEYDSLNCTGDADPVPLRVCDRLTYIVGTISEFYGFTEMGFPTWDTVLWDPEVEDCPVAAPAILTAADYRGNGARAMESFEAGMVQLVDVELGSAEDIVDCDKNKDGLVDFKDYVTSECSDECVCREACNDDPFCLEINQYWEYGQWPVRVGGAGGIKAWISTRQSVPKFDPYALTEPRAFRAIAGTLRHLSFLDPYPWIIEPRCEDDITRTGEPVPPSLACVIPRSGE